MADCEGAPPSRLTHETPLTLARRDARPVAGRRPRLASSLRSPLRAERGRGARGATGDARVHRGWFSPPQLSRDIARRGGALSPPPPRTSRVVLTAAAQPGHSAPRWCALSSSSSSLVPSPLVVLVSRLLFGRRSVLGRGAWGATGDARAARATRVHRGWFSPPLLGRDIARRGGPLLLVLLSCLSSRPSLRAGAAPSLHPRAGGAARAPRAGARARAERDATGAAREDSERGAPSESRARFILLGVRCALRARARAQYPSLLRDPGGQARWTTAAGRSRAISALRPRLVAPCRKRFERCEPPRRRAR